MDGNEITIKNIEGWKTYLSKIPTPPTSIYYTMRPTISPQTIQSKITAIRSFLKFINLIYDTGLDYRKIETKKIKSDYIECITEKEFRLFMNFIWDYEHYKINWLRSQLLVNIGYTSWLRLSEMLNLKVNDKVTNGFLKDMVRETIQKYGLENFDFENDYVKISVIDHGVGISEEELPTPLNSNQTEIILEEI